MLLQQPSAFEFTPLYLGTLAYHTHSMRFATFYFDSMAERPASCAAAACLWQWLDTVHAASPQVTPVFCHPATLPLLTLLVLQLPLLPSGRPHPRAAQPGGAQVSPPLPSS